MRVFVVFKVTNSLNLITAQGGHHHGNRQPKWVLRQSRNWVRINKWIKNVYENTRANTHTYTHAQVLHSYSYIFNTFMKLWINLNQYSPSGTRPFRLRPSRSGSAPRSTSCQKPRPRPAHHGVPGAGGGAHLCWGRQAANSHEDRVAQVWGVDGGSNPALHAVSCQEEGSITAKKLEPEQSSILNYF